MLETLQNIIELSIFWNIVWAIAGLVLINLVISLVQRWISRRLGDIQARYTARKMITFTGYIVMVLFVLGVFSNQLSSIGVALGVAGAGIAFALQEVIVSIAGWIAISFGQFYNVSDRVMVGGIKGDVIDIGILRTTLMEIGEWIQGDAYNGRIVRVANSFVFREPVYNYSADFPFVWDEIVLPVRYGSDYEFVRNLLLDAANEIVGDYTASAEDNWRRVVRKYLIEEAPLQPSVSLAANDNWVQFTLRYITDYKKRRSTKDALFTRILGMAEQAPEKITFASATFELVGFPSLAVNINPKSGEDQ
jgi:small-conductance mechanosensitive channel